MISISILVLLFCFRVIAQLLQYQRNLSYLPSFDAWHSATIPYSWLVLSQVLIITASVVTIIRIQKGLYRFYKIRGKLLMWTGSIYFLFMLFRFVLSISILRSHPWFGATLPAIFHMVLACILIIIGIYESSNTLSPVEKS